MQTNGVLPEVEGHALQSRASLEGEERGRVGVRDVVAAQVEVEGPPQSTLLAICPMNTILKILEIISEDGGPL